MSYVTLCIYNRNIINYMFSYTKLHCSQHKAIIQSFIDWPFLKQKLMCPVV